MSGTKGPYSHDTKWMMVTMVREGRTPRSLAEEFEPSEQTIRNWVKQADLDEGRRNDGMTTDVLTQVRRLERDNKRLRDRPGNPETGRGVVCGSKPVRRRGGRVQFLTVGQKT